MARRAIFGLLLEAVVVSAAVLAFLGGQPSAASTDPTALPTAGVAAATLDPTDAPTPTPTLTPTPTASPTPTAVATPTLTPDPFPVTNFAPLPKCAEGNTLALLLSYDQWSLVLVDKTYSLPTDYAPPDLVNVSLAGFGGGYKVRAVMIADLRQMRIDAANAHAALAMLSTYRSYYDQIWTFGHWVNALGPAAAAMSSAKAGHSEHQLGLAIDFREYGGPLPWAYKDWAHDTAAGAWLAKNAWKYGFVESYPWNKASQVCYGYEPWHYRYVGKAEAAAIHASGETSRLWLWQHQPDQSWRTAPAATPVIGPMPSAAATEPATAQP